MSSDTVIVPLKYRNSGSPVNNPCDSGPADDCPVRLGNRIRDIRLARGMRQTELARRSGLSQTTISDLERGRNVSSAVLPSIARALGLSTDELVYGTSAAPPADDDVSALLGYWQQLTPPQQTDLLDRMGKLVDQNREIARHLARLGLDRPVPDGEVAKHLPPPPKKTVRR